MQSVKRGKRDLAPELSNVSPRGLWLLLDGRELFLDFVRYPWFRNGTIGELSNIARPTAHHLYWPDLDIDLSVESIDKPEKFPLISKIVAKAKPATAVRERPRKR